MLVDQLCVRQLGENVVPATHFTRDAALLDILDTQAGNCVWWTIFDPLGRNSNPAPSIDAKTVAIFNSRASFAMQPFFAVKFDYAWALGHNDCVFKWPPPTNILGNGGDGVR